MPVYIDYGGNYYFNATPLSTVDELVVNPGGALVTALTAVSPSAKRVIWGTGGGAFQLVNPVYEVPASVSGTSRIFFQTTVPFILAGGTAGAGLNQFTAGASGAISTLTPLPTTYNSPGAWLYLPAGTFTGQAGAGWYWFVASSTTAGTVYNNTYTSGDPKAAIPASPTLFGAGAGLVTQTLSTDLQAASVTLPGGSMGANGRLDVTIQVATDSSAGNKTFRARFGTISMSGVGGFGSNSAAIFATLIYNNNSQTKQKTVNGGSSFSPYGAGGLGYTSIDTSTDQNINVTSNLSSAVSTYAVIEAVTMELKYGA